MRRIIIALLVVLLLLLVYVASCGPQPKNTDSSVPATAGEPAAAGAGDEAESNVQKAGEALRAAGFPSLNVQEVDGALLIRGEVDSPADRVRAGRSLAALGLPVINHIRATKPNVAKPFSLYLEKRNGDVTARGNISAAMHQLLKQRLELKSTSKVNETAVSTNNASSAVKLAAYAMQNMASGFVQVNGTTIRVEGQATGNDAALRTALNRQLPRGYSLASSVTPAQSESPTRTVAAPVPSKPAVRDFVKPSSQTAASNTVASEPVRATQPAADIWNRAPAQRAEAVVTEAPATANRYTKTTAAAPAESADPLDDYPIAETFPLESGDVVEPAYRDRQTVAEVIEEPVVQSGYAAVGSYDAEVGDDCQPGSVNLMPNGTIRFFHNSAKLTHKARPRMDLALGILRRCSNLNIAIEGHTDVTGSGSANGDISRARAERIYQYLVDEGVDPGRLLVTAYGDLRPAHSNDTKFGRAMNRRVELVVRD